MKEFSITVIFYFSICLMALPYGDNRPYWKAASYMGTPIVENNVGGVIFDPGIGGSNPECYSGNGTLTISLIYCPMNTLQYFNVSENRIILGQVYNVRFNSPFITDCLITCTDSDNTPTTVGLNIQIMGTNRYSPVWSLDFPRNINLTSLKPLQYIVSTLATDEDVDKTSSGRVSYSVVTVDGAPPTQDNYLSYEEGGNSSRLQFYFPPQWAPSSTHLVVVKAQDNPTIGTPNSITLTLTFATAINALTYSVNFSTTTPTTTSTTTGTTSTGSTSSTDSTTTTTGLSTSQAALVDTTTVSPGCSGINVVVCNNNWIWLVLGIGLFFLLGGIIFVLIVYMLDRDRNPADVQPLEEEDSDGDAQNAYNYQKAPQQQQPQDPNYVA